MARLTTWNLLCDLFTTLPPVNVVDLSQKTVIVVGANTGLGFEASKHFARMNPGRLILACRSTARGEAAIKELDKETGFKRAELWLIDLADFSSVKAFADKFEKDGGRLDILVENAAMISAAYTPSMDGWESSLQVNFLAPSLLALLLLPRMIWTAQEYATRPRITCVTSELHMVANPDMEVLNGSNILKTVGSEEYCTPSVMRYRYNDTKLLNVFFARALNDRIPSSTKSVIVNSVNPGFCVSELRRSLSGLRATFAWVLEKLIARTTEQGSRNLVYAALGQPEDEEQLRGAYINCSRVGEAGDFVLSEDGKAAQDKIWNELVELLRGVDPRVGATVTNHLT